MTPAAALDALGDAAADAWWRAHADGLPLTARARRQRIWLELLEAYNVAKRWRAIEEVGGDH